MRDIIFKKQVERSLLLRLEHFSQRKARINALKNWILDNRKEIQQAVNADFSKPLVEVETTEIYTSLAEIRFALAHLSEWMKPKKVDAPLTFLGTKAEIRVEPKGVCLIISPWNFPFLLAVGPLISCLAAGNTAIIKPSELTPNTAQLLSKMVKDIFEENIVTVIQGGVEETSQLLRLPFDHIFFTGSPAVGKIVMKAAAENLTSVTLELGGKSPAIIDKSAILKDAAKRIAFGKFFNNGQTCIAPDYILIDEIVADKFLVLLKEEVSRLFGKDIAKSNDYARIVNSNHFKRLTELLTDAQQHGAKIEFGGNINIQDNFIEPTIISNAALNSKVMLDEIFGPLLPIIRYNSIQEAIELINSKPKPLALYIFSEDHHFRNKLLNSTTAGSVCINECVLQFSHPNLPFGGVNNSGIGKSHGYAGFLTFSNEKPVLKQKRGFALSYFLHPPYTKPMKRIVDLMVRWF